MRKNKLSRLLEPSLRLYFLCLVAFAALSALFSLPLAAGELAGWPWEPAHPSIRRPPEGLPATRFIG